MTLSQEQQPQERRGTGSGAPANQQPRSRREARDAERRAQSVETAETGELSNVHPSGAYDLNASGNIWDTVSRTAASQLTDAATEAERRTGRRVADRDREHTPAPEPLSYVTQARPNIPTYDAPSFRDRLQQVAESAGATSAAFRERDFAPTPTAPAAPAAPQPVVELDYHTQTRTPPLRPMPAASTPAAPAPVAPTRVASAPVEAPEPASTLDHTLTRRELRVLRETGAIPPFTPADLAPREGGWQATPDPAPASVSPPVGFREPAPLTPVAGIPLGSAFTSYEDTATAPMSAIDRAALLADEPVQKKSRAVKPASEAWEGDIPLGGPTSAPVDAPIAEPVSAAPAPRSAVPTPPRPRPSRRSSRSKTSPTSPMRPSRVSSDSRRSSRRRAPVSSLRPDPSRMRDRCRLASPMEGRTSTVPTLRRPDTGRCRPSAKTTARSLSTVCSRAMLAARAVPRML